MKKVGFLFFLAALVIGLVVANTFSFGRASTDFVKFSVNFGSARGSGNIVTEKREVSGFKSVDVGGVFQVEIVAQKEFGVEVEADDNLIGLIQTRVDGDTLRIESDKRLKSSSPIKIRISAPKIDGLQVSGAANVTANGLNSESLKIESSGGSRVTVAGEAVKLTVESSGGARVNAGGLSTVDANIEGSGGSSVEVSVTGDLRSDISGGARVTYSGTPANIVTNKSGGARVSQK
ncbi:MAG: DUF2807 domain-containing protein [Acidobacteria bacterium]|nr:DUF2807 domain-containing protein [Acidobacteriota bacterium]